MITLHFGFVDIPYSQRMTATIGGESVLSIRRRRGRKKFTRSQSVYGEGKTTAQVAKELEQSYGIVESFVVQEREYIKEVIGQNFRRNLLSRMKGEPPAATIIPQEALDAIVTRFQWGMYREMYHKFGKVPTTAATRGVQHQFARPYQKRSPRTSFIDTGMYVNTFRVWTR